MLDRPSSTRWEAWRAFPSCGPGCTLVFAAEKAPRHRDMPAPRLAISRWRTLLPNAPGKEKQPAETAPCPPVSTFTLKDINRVVSREVAVSHDVALGAAVGTDTGLCGCVGDLTR